MSNKIKKLNSSFVTQNTENVSFDITNICKNNTTGNYIFSAINPTSPTYCGDIYEYNTSTDEYTLIASNSSGPWFLSPTSELTISRTYYLYNTTSVYCTVKIKDLVNNENFTLIPGHNLLSGGYYSTFIWYDKRTLVCVKTGKLTFYDLDGTENIFSTTDIPYIFKDYHIESYDSKVIIIGDTYTYTYTDINLTNKTFTLVTDTIELLLPNYYIETTTDPVVKYHVGIDGKLYRNDIELKDYSSIELKELITFPNKDTIAVYYNDGEGYLKDFFVDGVLSKTINKLKFSIYNDVTGAIQLKNFTDITELSFSITHNIPDLDNVVRNADIELVYSKILKDNDVKIINTSTSEEMNISVDSKMYNIRLYNIDLVSGQDYRIAINGSSFGTNITEYSLPFTTFISEFRGTNQYSYINNLRKDYYYESYETGEYINFDYFTFEFTNTIGDNVVIMDALTITKIAGDVNINYSYVLTGNKLTIKLLSVLESNTEYSVVINNLFRDEFGNSLVDYDEYNFIILTETLPSMLSGFMLNIKENYPYIQMPDSFEVEVEDSTKITVCFKIKLLDIDRSMNIINFYRIIGDEKTVVISIRFAETYFLAESPEMANGISVSCINKTIVYDEFCSVVCTIDLDDKNINMKVIGTDDVIHSSDTVSPPKNYSFSSFPRPTDCVIGANGEVDEFQLVGEVNDLIFYKNLATFTDTEALAYHNGTPPSGMFAQYNLSTIETITDGTATITDISGNTHNSTANNINETFWV